MDTERKELIEVVKPVRTKLYLTMGMVVFMILASFWFAGFSIIDVILNLDNSFRMLGRLFFPPNWSFAPRVIPPIIETLQMAIVGTFVGALTAIPIALLAASNFTQNPFFNKPTRFILNIFRTIPALVLASLFVAVFGLGTFAGVLALSIFTFGLVSKLTYETIETIDHGQVEALISVGGNKIDILRYAIIPQVLPQYMSYVLYGLEVNVRAAAVLGFVGAGGIGQTYEFNQSWRLFDNVGMIIIISFSFVLAIDLISSSIRRRLV